MSLIIKFEPIITGSGNATKEIILESDSFQAANKSYHNFNLNIKNAKVTLDALVQMGAEDVLYNTRYQWILFRVDGILMRIKVKDSVLDIYQNISNNDAEAFTNEIEEHYMMALQSAVYEKVKANAQEKGIVLQNEVIQQDQTIVLTYEF